MSHLRKSSAILLTAVIAGLVLSACAAAAGKDAAGNNPPTSLPEPTWTPFHPAEGEAAPGGLPVSPTPLPSSTPAGPSLYADEQYGFQFSYPARWQKKGPGALEGKDGFARVEASADDGARPDAGCQLEANRDKPARYGAIPEIISLKLPSFRAACLVMPSPDQPADRLGEAALLAWFDAPAGPARLALHADLGHIASLSESLRLPAQEETAGSPAAQPNRCLPPDGLAPGSIREAGLLVDEFPAAQAAGCIPEDDPDLFNQVAAGPQAVERFERLVAGQHGWARVNRLNAALAPFGVRIWSNGKLFTISQGGRVVTSRMSWIGRPAVNAARTDFYLPVEDSYDSGAYLLRPDGLHPLENWDILLFDRIFPVYAGDDLISLAYDTGTIQRPLQSPALLNVLKNGEVVQTYSVSGSSAAGGAARYLASWEGSWLLELSGVLVQDGEILNDRLGYSEMFAWRLLNGKPFYFYRQDGKVNASYDGQDLILGYDEVIYQPLCCKAVLLKMRTFETGLTFFARRGETWYFVTLQA